MSSSDRRLDSHPADVNETGALERFELIEAQMRSAEGVTERLESTESGGIGSCRGESIIRNRLPRKLY